MLWEFFLLYLPLLKVIPEPWYQVLLSKVLFPSLQFLRAYSGISIKWRPLVQKKKCPLYRAVRFIEIFSKIVWPQSKATRSSSYCPAYRGVRFIVCPLYRDSTVSFLERTSLFNFQIATNFFNLRELRRSLLCWGISSQPSTMFWYYTCAISSHPKSKE